MDERMARICSSEMEQPAAPAGSTVIVWPSCSTRQPRRRSMPRAASTSVSRGQLWSVTGPRASRQAAKMGSTLFFAPWTASSPFRAPPPRMYITLMAKPPHRKRFPPILCGWPFCRYFWMSSIRFS